MIITWTLVLPVTSRLTEQVSNSLITHLLSISNFAGCPLQGPQMSGEQYTHGWLGISGVYEPCSKQQVPLLQNKSAPVKATPDSRD